jgi:hypothetical protein
MKKVVDMTREYLDEVNAKPGEYSFCIGYGYDYNEALEFREMLKDAQMDDTYAQLVWRVAIMSNTSVKHRDIEFQIIRFRSESQGC